MKHTAVPKKVTSLRGQSKEWAEFANALHGGQISSARDLITHIFTATNVIVRKRKYPAKQLGYKLIFKLARKSGDLDSMLEIAPFFGHEMTKKDYVKCKKHASRTNRSEDVKACKEVLKKQWSK